MKNNNLTSLDTDQINKRRFDEELDADRVIIVGQEFSIDSDKIAQAVKEGLSNIQFNDNGQMEKKIESMLKSQSKVVNSTPIQTIKENVFIPEVKIIEVPVIIKEIEYREIEKPIIIEKVITVDRQVIVKEIEIKEIYKERYYPFVMKASAVVQAVCVIGLLLINLLKK